MMRSVLRRCRKCGAEIFADAPEGLCTACLFETGLNLLAGESVAGVDLSAVASAKADNSGPDDDVPLSRDKKKSDRAKMLANFGDYELLDEIGRGGQGVVYCARQKSLNRTVALKVIGLGHWATEAHLKRFRREAEAAASLEHSGIVPIYEVGEHDGSCYFSMKFVEGGQLDAVVKSATADSSGGEREPMPIRRAVELIVKVARTVHYAHEHGILHRDIKPGNILLDRKGEPHLTDFGLARLVEVESTVTRTLEVLGTPSYMAPEQAVGNNAAVSSATDVYGIGAVLYQLLTGHPPFAGGTTYETIKLLLDTEPRQPRLWNPKIDRDLSTICLKCLEKDPQRRYSSALTLAEDLERWLKHEPILARRTGLITRGGKWVRRNPGFAAMAVMLLALAVPLGVIIWKREFVRPPPTTGIAVLPFENLSDEKEHAFFADGVQDDILIKLAKIAELKVISRTSVMQYRGKQDVRQIGNALRVSHVLEGTVRRSGGKVHINAELVDARTDAGIWAEEYDRDLNDVFAIEAEVAQSIANRLRAKVSAREKMAMQEWPTKDLVAYDLYTRARVLLLPNYRSNAKANLLQAADLLSQAIAHDPSFFQAYCQLAQTHDLLYFYGHDHTPARLESAEAAIQAAFRLRPDAGEAHLTRAQNLYRAYRDYEGAQAELEVAGRTLPNDPEVFALKGYIQRRQGRQDEALRNLAHAVDLDPRDFTTLQQIANGYHILRRYAEETSVLDRALAIEPNDVNTKVALAALQFHWKADTEPLHRTINSIRTTNPDSLPNVAYDWINCALAERDAAAAKNALNALGDIPMTDYEIHLNRPLIEGVLARMAKDEGEARAAFTAAGAEQQEIVRAQPNYGPPLCVLGLIDAALGRKEDALREGRRAVELLPAEKDAVIGKLMIEYLAMIAAWVGDKELACEQLAIAVRPPSTISYGQLKLLPFWDPLRGDPRFEKIVEESKQPVTLK